MALQQPKRGEMKNAVGAVQRGIEDIGLADIAARRKCARGILHRRFEIFQ